MSDMRWRVLAVTAGAVVPACHIAVDTAGLSSGGAAVTDGADRVAADAAVTDGADPIAADAGDGACSSPSFRPPTEASIVPLDPRWILLGSAAVDGSALNLTSGKRNQSGAIWWSERITFNNFDVAATFRIQAPNPEYPGDGLTFVWVKDRLPELGEAGDALGVAGLNGWAVAIDLFANSPIADAPYVAIFDTKKSLAARTLVARTVPFPILDGASHVLDITLRSGVISVSVDQNELIESFALPGYVPFTGYFGFTGTTGDAVAVQTLVRAGLTTDTCP
jgi:hypothetical protein